MHKNITKYTLIFMFLSLIFQPADADNLNIKNNAWEKISDSCCVKKIQISRPETNNQFDLIFIKFSLEKIKIRILDTKMFGEIKQTVSFLAQKSGAFCVINGGFFDENYNPLGILVINGKVLQKMPEYGNFAIFCIKCGKPAIIHKRDFSYKEVTEAIQCSPRLMAEGEDTEGIYDADEVSRRSGIGLDYDNNIIIYVTDTIFDGLSFNELRKIFKQKDINIKTALSLDGGKSTQLYFNLNNYKIDIPGYEDIPIGIGFF